MVAQYRLQTSYIYKVDTDNIDEFMACETASVVPDLE